MNEPVAGRMRLKVRSPRCGKYLGLLLHAPTQTACRDRQTAYCSQRPVCHTRSKVMTVQAWSSLDLEHLISAVPVILDALPQYSLMAVHATSRALRSRVQAIIPRIVVTSWMATDKLDPHTWAALTSFTGALQLLNLPIKPWLHLRFLSMEQAGLSTDALQLLVSSSWPALQHLNLANTNLHSTRMTLLLQANWSGLKSLQLERCNLNSGSIAALTAASLPCLEAIDLAHNTLAIADIAQFSKGSWPELRSLDLHRVACKGTLKKIMAWSTGETTKEFMQHLSSANWPKLAQLRLRSCDLNAANMEWLVKCPWHLQELDLSEQLLSEESCRVFKHGRWPLLERLDLSNTDLGSLGMRCFATAELPKLTSISFASNVKLTADAFAVEPYHRWSCLERLCLRGIRVSANALIVLQHWTDWSSLKYLDIASPQLDAAAVHVLCVKWKMPELQCLELGLSKHFTREVMCELLKGANQADVVLKPGHNAIQNPAYVACGRWPCLHTIHFDYVEHDSHCFQHCKRDCSIQRFPYGQPVMSAMSRYRYSCWESYVRPS